MDYYNKQFLSWYKSNNGGYIPLGFIAKSKTPINEYSPTIVTNSNFTGIGVVTIIEYKTIE